MSGSITVYTNANYTGSSKQLGVGRYNDIGIGNDSLSSLRIGAGMKATLYADGGFKGSSMVCVRDTPYVGNGVNDRISSIVVEELTASNVIVYQDAQYQGWSTEFTEGAYNTDRLANVGNDTVTSVIVPDGYKVTLYEDGNFSGKSVILLGDSAGLDGFNDRVSSLRVEKMKALPAPTLAELKQIIEQTAPRLYLHPNDEFGVSSVDWFLARATLKGSDGSARPTSTTALPTGGSDDGSFWLELPTSARAGDLSTAVAYVNAKASTYYVDVQYWFFYPYNGAGNGRITVTGASSDIDLNPMGEHGGDWEHVMLRIELGTRALLAVYLAQHSGGEWVGPGDLQYEGGIPVVYASRHGHASYKSEGSNLTNDTKLKDSVTGVTWFEFGLRNDTGKGQHLDCRSKYQIVGGSFLGTALVPPSWLDYCHRWGPHKVYDRAWIKSTIQTALGNFPGSDSAADAVMNALPDEFKEENGPTGPKKKGSWTGSE